MDEGWVLEYKGRGRRWLVGGYVAWRGGTAGEGGGPSGGKRCVRMYGCMYVFAICG